MNFVLNKYCKKEVKKNGRNYCYCEVMNVDPIKNFKHVDTTCECCKSSNQVRFDEHRGEIFCANCGTVLYRVSDILSKS